MGQKKGDMGERYLPLLTCSVKDCDEDDLRFCFSIMSPDKTLNLQADNEYEKNQWIRTIQV